MRWIITLFAALVVTSFGCDAVRPAGQQAPVQDARAGNQETVSTLTHTTLPAKGDDKRLAMLLHGFGSNEKDLPSLARRLGLNGPVVSFRAPIDLERGGYAWFARDLRTNATPEKLTEFDRSLDRLVVSLKAARAEYPEHEVVVIGFSQGAMMAAVIAAEHGDLIDRAIVLSGAVPRKLQTSPAKPRVFIAHGDKDRVVSPVDGKALAMRLQQRGLDVAYRTYPEMGHRILPAVVNDAKAWLAE